MKHQRNYFSIASGPPPLPYITGVWARKPQSLSSVISFRGTIYISGYQNSFCSWVVPIHFCLHRLLIYLNTRNEVWWCFSSGLDYIKLLGNDLSYTFYSEITRTSQHPLFHTISVPLEIKWCKLVIYQHAASKISAPPAALSSPQLHILIRFLFK